MYNLPNMFYIDIEVLDVYTCCWEVQHYNLISALIVYQQLCVHSQTNTLCT